MKTYPFSSVWRVGLAAAVAVVALTLPLTSVARKSHDGPPGGKKPAKAKVFAQKTLPAARPVAQRHASPHSVVAQGHLPAGALAAHSKHSAGGSVAVAQQNATISAQRSRNARVATSLAQQRAANATIASQSVQNNPRLSSSFTRQRAINAAPVGSGRSAFVAYPRTNYVVTQGTGYAGTGYYYGPPGAAYYYETPGVRFYRDRSLIPAELLGLGLGLALGSSYPEPYPYRYGYGHRYVSHYGNSTAFSVQRALADRGYYYGAIDGEIGPASRDAIARFQSEHGLAPTGMIDNALLSDLGIY